MKIYTNIPQSDIANGDSASSTKNIINNFYNVNLPINAGVYDALKGFFGSNGFSDVASDTIAYVILYQASIDDYNPMQVLENIQGLDGVQLNALVTEILNFNRFKTSFLGRSAAYGTTPSVTREILS
jgi:hypothetical protein